MRYQLTLTGLILGALFAAACATNTAPTTTTTATATSPTAKPMSKTEIEQALFQIEKDGTAAMIKNDTGFLERIMADDWMWTMSDGTMVTRANLIKEVKEGSYKFTDVSMSDLHANVYGDTAIVMGKQTVKGKYKGQDIGGTDTFTDTFVKLNGQWRCVASHNSPAPKK